MASLERFYRLNNVIGIHIHLEADGHLEIAICGLSGSGSDLQITSRITGLKSLAELKENIPVKSPVAVCFTGKGVLYKKIDLTTEVTPVVFSKLLPNADIDDFYVQNFPNGEHSYIAFVRKAEADKWLDTLMQAGHPAIILSLGVFPVQSVLPHLNNYGEELTFNGHQVTLDGQGIWLAYQYSGKTAPFPLKVGEETISEKLLIAYAIAFQLILFRVLDPVKVESITLDDRLDTRLQLVKLKVWGAAFAFFLFFALLVNFLLLSSLNNENIKLSQQITSQSQGDQERDTLTKTITEQEVLLSNAGWDKDAYKSKKVNQVAQLLPDGVMLTEFNINPVDVEKTRTERNMVFRRREFLMRGSSENIIPINELVARIKAQKWVKEVQLESYQYSLELKTGVFTIIIIY